MNLPDIRLRYPLAYLAAACVLTVACFNLIPGTTLAGSLAQTAAAGACVLALLTLFDPAVLKRQKAGSLQSACFRSAEKRAARREEVQDGEEPPAPSAQEDRGDRKARWRGKVFDGGWLLAVAAALGAATAIFVSAPPPAHLPGVSAAAIGGFLLLCLATGVFEEGLFRGSMFPVFADVLKRQGSARPVLVAAILSAVVFGLLHVTGVPPGPAASAAPFTATSASTASPFDAITAAQLIAKPVQAALFGFVMAGLFARTGTLWLVALLHAAFNGLSEAPTFVLTGTLPITYATGNPVDLIIVVVSAALMVPLVIRAARTL